MTTPSTAPTPDSTTARPPGGATGPRQLVALGAPLALALLGLLFMESTRFSGPWRRAVTFDPVTYHEGLGLLVLLAVPVSAWLAWRLGNGGAVGRAAAGGGAPAGGGVLAGGGVPAGAARLLPGSGPRLRALYLVLIAAYTLAVAVSSASSGAEDAATSWYALQVAMVPAEVVLFGFLLPAILRRADAEVVIRALVWLLAAFAVLSLAWLLTGRQEFFGLPLSQPPDDRGGRLASSGFFVHRNTIGGFLALVIPAGAWLAWTQARRGERRTARVTAALVALLLVWLILCFSRSSELAIATAAVTTTVLLAWTARPGSPGIARAQRAFRRLTMAGVVAAILGGVVAAWLIATRPEVRSAIEGALTGRVGLWIDVWNKTEGHRLIGPGLLGVEAVGPAGRFYGQVYDPHNAWLVQLVYFGVPGLIAFSGLFVTMAAEGFRRYRREVRVAPQQAILAAGILGLALQNVFEYFLTDPVLFSNGFALLLLGWWRTGLWEDAAD